MPVLHRLRADNLQDKIIIREDGKCCLILDGSERTTVMISDSFHPEKELLTSDESEISRLFLYIYMIYSARL